MKRDPMRVFAWLLVALGAANIVLTIPVVNALNKIADEVSSHIARTYGRGRADHLRQGRGLASHDSAKARA